LKLPVAVYNSLPSVRCSLCFLAFLFLPINLTAFAFGPKERMNNATGMINLARNIGGSVGISLLTTQQARLMHRHQVRLIENLSSVNPRYMAMLSSGSWEFRAWP